MVKHYEEEYENIFVNKGEAISKITEETLLVVVDTNKNNYVEIPELLEKTNKIVVIDHHRKSPDFIENTTLTFHEVYASSAAELVTELLQYTDVNVELSKLLLLYALYTVSASEDGACTFVIY